MVTAHRSIVHCVRAKIEWRLVPGDRCAALKYSPILRMNLLTLGQRALDPRFRREVAHRDRVGRKVVATDEHAFLAEKSVRWIHDLADALIGARDAREDAIVFFPKSTLELQADFHSAFIWDGGD